MPDPRRALVWFGICAGAALAGLAAQSAGIPAAWLVAPMFVAVLVALAWSGRPRVAHPVRQISLAVVGGVLASTFKPSVVSQIASLWLPVGIVVSGTLLLSVGVGLLLSRVGGLDRKTASLGTLPGAASGMLAMSEPLGADPRLVALMQYTRVLVVVFSAALISRLLSVSEAAGAPAGDLASAAPRETLIQSLWLTYLITLVIAAIGGWAGTRLKLPAGGLLGPLLLGVALEEVGLLHLTWPPGVPEAAYLVLGLYVGLLFDRESVKRAGRLLPYVLVTSVLLVVACAGLGWLLATLTPIDPMTAYLATTPGGIDSVAIMALGSGADASLVLAAQMLRLFAVILAGSIFGRLWSGDHKER